MMCPNVCSCLISSRALGFGAPRWVGATTSLSSEPVPQVHFFPKKLKNRNPA